MGKSILNPALVNPCLKAYCTACFLQVSRTQLFQTMYWFELMFLVVHISKAFWKACSTLDRPFDQTGSIELSLTIDVGTFVKQGTWCSFAFSQLFLGLRKPLHFIVLLEKDTWNPSFWKYIKILSEGWYFHHDALYFKSYSKWIWHGRPMVHLPLIPFG